jgi:hypothetical protein
LCGEEFSDTAAFRVHLAEVHDLHDDEDAETTLPAPSPPREPATQVQSLVPAGDWTNSPRVPRKDVELGRPTGWIALVVVSIMALVLALAVTFVRQRDQVASPEVAGPEVTDGTAGSSTSTPSSSEPTTAPLPPGTVAVTAAGPPSSPSGSGSPGGPTTTAPPPPPTTTATTQPPVTFKAPTTAAAKIDSCTRDRNQWTVVYSWNFAGGTNWRPLPTYRSLGGGRYRAVTTLNANPKSSITGVQVLSQDGARHNVALNPALSATAC